MITAKAPGKMILVGEYAVLHSGKALVSAMDCYASVTLSATDTHLFEISAPSLSIKSIPFYILSNGQLEFVNINDDNILKKLHFFRIVFEEINKIVLSKGNQFQPIKIEIDTDDFYSANRENKYGFGSSAAMTVAFIQALLKSVNLLGDYNKHDFFQLAFRIHRKAQGNLGSGIDVAASIYGNVLTYQLKEEKGVLTGYGQPVECWDDLFVVPIWVGHSTSTRKMVRSVDALKESSPRIFNQIMNALIQCSENGCESYMQKDKTAFYEAIREFNKILSYLGKQSNTPIISDVHRKLIDLISDSDVVYKPSGAGGGDIGVAFCDSMNAVKKIKRLINQTDFQVLDFDITNEGVSVYEIE